jgi:hypothetical protein
MSYCEIVSVLTIRFHKTVQDDLTLLQRRQRDADAIKVKEAAKAKKEAEAKANAG